MNFNFILFLSDDAATLIRIELQLAKLVGTRSRTKDGQEKARQIPTDSTLAIVIDSSQISAGFLILKVVVQYE